MTTLSAIDVGYRGVKALATNGRAAHFPSEIGTERKAAFSLEEARKDSLVVATEDGQVWHVGEAALKQSGYSAGRRDPGWIFTGPYEVLLCAALSELHRSTATTSVVTGLPLEHYAALADHAREVFLGPHTFRRSGRRRQTVTVEDVLVVTQPYGSLADAATSESGRFLDNPFATGVVGVADVGGVTLNLLVTEAMEEVGRWTRGADLGLLEAVDRIADEIRVGCPGLRPKAREVAGWLVEGTFPYQGREVDVAPYAAPHLEPLAETILNHVSEVWSEPGRLAAVLLTGGGAAILGPTLRARMEGTYANVTVARDPVFANVRGYLKLARRTWG